MLRRHRSGWTRRGRSSSSRWPLFLLSVGLLFIYVRRRAGEWLALAAILPILFLGPSWDDLLFPFQMALFGSVACGIGALLALERRDRIGDLAATVLLTASLLFSDVGIPFVAGATVELALDRDRLRRAFVVAVPTALFWLIWYPSWGHDAANLHLLRNVANLPSYVLDGLASSLATWLGLGGAGAYDASPRSTGGARCWCSRSASRPGGSTVGRPRPGCWRRSRSCSASGP